MSLVIDNESPVAVIGANGSGKSTFLKIISGLISYDSGNIKYFSENNTLITSQNVFKHTAFLAPYLDLIEEFNLIEILNFHTKFVQPVNNLTISNIIDLLEFSKYQNLTIKNFSSGMKQKLKIALCLFFNKPFLLFDEPCTNLDNIAIEWYKKMINIFLLNRALIVCSNNINHEIFNCTKIINIENYK